MNCLYSQPLLFFDSTKNNNQKPWQSYYSWILIQIEISANVSKSIAMKIWKEINQNEQFSETRVVPDGLQRIWGGAHMAYLLIKRSIQIWSILLGDPRGACFS